MVACWPSSCALMVNARIEPVRPDAFPKLVRKSSPVTNEKDNLRSEKHPFVRHGFRQAP